MSSTHFRKLSGLRVGGGLKGGLSDRQGDYNHQSYHVFFCCSVAKSCLTLCDPMDCSIPGFPVLHYLLEFAQIHMHWVSDSMSNHLILCHPLLLLPSMFPIIFSNWVFSSESALHIRWPKYWSFSSSISPSNEYSGFISFRIDWFDLLAVRGTLKSLLQHHNLKAPIFRCSAFFMVQLSHAYMATGKTIALTMHAVG